jgi:exodeoxyribonuclease VII large subunit
VRFKVAYAAMQGANAARDVMEQLDKLDRDPEVDVIVIARGGGSIEDLLPFSDEGLVRAVFNTSTIVVSAIGHEPDTPLLDLVADVRASTPTDAAKLVVPDVAEEAQRVRQLRDRARSILQTWLANETRQLDAVRQRPVLGDPRGGLAERSEEVTDLVERARRSVGHRLDRAHDDVGHHLARVRALSPLATLKRGYSVLQDADGHVVTSIDQTKPGAKLRASVADGRIDVHVDGTESQ